MLAVRGRAASIMMNCCCAGENAGQLTNGTASTSCTVNRLARFVSIPTVSVSITSSPKSDTRTAPARCGLVRRKSLALSPGGMWPQAKSRPTPRHSPDFHRRARASVLACLPGLTGELAEFDDNDKITGGQVMQIKELVLKYQIPLVCVEVNRPGSFAGKLLIQALKGTGCGVREEFSVTNKQSASSMHSKRRCRRGSSGRIPTYSTAQCTTRCETLTRR